MIVLRAFWLFVFALVLAFPVVMAMLVNAMFGAFSLVLLAYAVLCLLTVGGSSRGAR